MKLKTLVLAMLVALAVTATGCGLAGNLMGRNAGTVSTLWTDVPPYPNASKANIDIPLPVQFVIQGFMQAANADNSSGVRLDKFDFVVYQTSDTPEAVANFYTTDKMTAAGWDSQDSVGCSAGAGSAGSAGAGFCAFTRKGDAGKQTVLLLVPVQDDQTKQTQLFYVRIEGTPRTPQP